MSQVNLDVITAENKENLMPNDFPCVHAQAFQGRDSEYVALISKDQFHFLVKREDAVVSPLLSAALSKPDLIYNVVILYEMSPAVLAKICCYLPYKKTHPSSRGPVQDFFEDSTHKATEAFWAAIAFLGLMELDTKGKKGLRV